MKKKILLLLLVSTVITIGIYLLFQDKKVYYVALGDGVAKGMTAFSVKGYSYNDYIKDELENAHDLEKYLDAFTEADLRVKDLNLLIEKNHEMIVGEKSIPIQQALAKADVITLQIGMDEIAAKEKVTTKDLKTYQKELEKTFRYLKRYANNTVIIIGFYYNNVISNKVVDTINQYLEELSIQNKYRFINPTDILQGDEYFFTPKSHYITYKGHRVLADEIRKYL